MNKREVSHLTEAHDSSTGLSTSIPTVHYTNLGFPIPNQGPVLGVSPSSCAISVFVCGGGSFYFAESQLLDIPTLNRHTHSQIKKITARRRQSAQNLAKQSAQRGGFQTGSGWVEGTTSLSSPLLSAGSRLGQAGGGSPLPLEGIFYLFLGRAPGTKGKIVEAGTHYPSAGRRTQEAEGQRAAPASPDGELQKGD